MFEERLKKLAQVIVHYSLEIKSGDLVSLMGEWEGLPLYTALYEEMIKAGAHVTTTFIPPRWEEIFFRYAAEHQLTHLSPFAQHIGEGITKRIRVIAPENTRALSHVDSKKQAAVSRARAPLLSTTMERSAKGELDWVVTLCPTAALAQEAGMGFEEYADFVFKAGYLDQPDPVAAWRALQAQQDKMIAYLTKVRTLRFVTPEGTDLTVNVEGMTWRNSCGRRNFPDGEVFTGPNLSAAEGGVNGVVRYTYPAILQHTVVEDVELTFERGRVVAAHAKRNESFLKAMLEQDEGASFMGEIAMGTNYNINTFSQNILFDEKIGGTFHAAVGMGYPETGNTNQSALHWDMICDLRQGGEILADGQVIARNGRFLIEGWPQA